MAAEEISKKSGVKRKRKAAVKKSPAVGRSRVPDAKPEQYFILVTGTPLKNIKELALALEMMEEWVFRHHVNENRNDFSNWMRGVFGFDDLAQEILGSRSRNDIEIKIMRYLISRYM